MTGLGTFINTGSIIAGGMLGLFCGRFFTPQMQETVRKVCGISTIFIGISGALEGMLAVQDGALTSRWGLLVTLSLVLGAIVGEALGIESWLETFGKWLRTKSGASRDARFVNGFVTASLTVCIGAMAIIGSIEDGIHGNISILTTKSVLDFIIIWIMTSSMGRGCIFSAVPVFLLQGGITLLAGFLAPIFTPVALSCLSAVGSILIFCVGLNLVWGSIIRAANLLPAVFFATLLPFLPAFQM